MKAVLGGKSVSGQIWLCGLYLSAAKKKMKELNRHDEPQFFTAAKLKYIT